MALDISKQSMLEMAELVAVSVVNALKEQGVIGKQESKPRNTEKTSFAKTETLLYNYRNFQRIIQERKLEIEEIKLYGVPQQCGAVGERVQSSNVPSGIVLEEESVENAVHRIHCAIQPTVQAIALIDKCMAALSKDPYYRILELRYFEGRTQEDIALEFGVSQVTISNNKNRLVRELAMRLFPDQVIHEMMK